MTLSEYLVLKKASIKIFRNKKISFKILKKVTKRQQIRQTIYNKEENRRRSWENQKIFFKITISRVSFLMACQLLMWVGQVTTQKSVGTKVIILERISLIQKSLSAWIIPSAQKKSPQNDREQIHSTTLLIFLDSSKTSLVWTLQFRSRHYPNKN